MNSTFATPAPRVDPYRPELTYLGIGKAGVYGRKGPNCSVSIPDTRLSAYYGDLIDGGLVVDKRPVPDDDLVKWVVSGPMLDLALPEKSCHPLWEEVQPCADARLLEHAALTDISLDLYLDLWRSLGARIGVREGDDIVWEDGAREQIRPAELRYQGE